MKASSVYFVFAANNRSPRKKNGGRYLHWCGYKILSHPKQELKRKTFEPPVQDIQYL